MNKIKVGLVFKNKETAKAFVCENMPYGKTKRDSENEFIYETSMVNFVWLKPFGNFSGFRLNFVFTTEDIRDTDWFDTVIRPMQMVGTGSIDQIY